MKQKLLLVIPHASTGGAPQWSVKKVELLKDAFDIKVIEYSFLAWQFVVQRNRMIELVGQENFHSLSGDKVKMLIEIVEDFKPDVIAMEEFPEMFMDIDAAKYLYGKDMYIIETTHDSSFDPRNKQFLPDEFVFVSAYSALKYSHLDIPSTIIEYPVDIKGGQQSSARETLGLSDSVKHIVIVGLFTPRKNQRYAFQLAERLSNYNVQFHFIGNQAENFAEYWKPLMDKKPHNCQIWGERDDVDTFLKAADLFLFPSKGDRGNKELQPLVIKEAQQYLYLPKLMFNLDVYLNKYNDLTNFNFLTGDLIQDAEKIVQITGAEDMGERKDREIIIIGTYPNTQTREKLTIECINSLKSLDRKIMLVSHYPVSKDIQDMVDYYVYDKNNPLIPHSYYTHFYHDTSEYYAQVNINGLKNTNQSLAVLTNMFNGMKMAESLGFERAFYLTFDVIVHRKDLRAIHQSFNDITLNNHAYLATLDTPFGKGIQTNGMTFDINFFLANVSETYTEQEFNDECKRLNCHNFLEDYFMKVMQQHNDITIVHPAEQTFLKHSGLGISSNSEYYSILPVAGKSLVFMFYFFTYNRDDRELYIELRSAKQTYQVHSFKFSEVDEFCMPIVYFGDELTLDILFEEAGNIIKTESYTINDETIESFKNNGTFRYKKKQDEQPVVRPKIKLVHLQTSLNDEREQKSREQLQQVCNYGWNYHLHTNIPYTDLPPKHNCQRPECVSYQLFDEDTVQRLGTALTNAHYGCYQAFRDAILSEFNESIDFLIICEGDCKVELPIDEFVRKVEQIALQIDEHNVGYHSFGDTKTLEHGWPQSPVIEKINDDVFITNHIIGLQCIMFPKRVREWLKETLRITPWDAADMYYNSIFKNSPYKMSIGYQRLTSQFDGFSLIDKTEKKFI
jgi:glycosyltransferase involved in cell wall biosynthesis